MAIDYPGILARRFSPVFCQTTARDSILYALSLGLGCDPLDPQQLKFVYERKQVALPSMACVIGYKTVREMDLGIDYARMVHSEQSLTILKPIPVCGRFVSDVCVESVSDCGIDKGAQIHLRRVLRDADTMAVLAEMITTLLCRADGGFGGPPPAPRAARDDLHRDPDCIFEQQVSAQAALLYRLNGDMNPLHADPEEARRVGWDRPILHGLATFGMACRAVLAGLCDYEPERIRTVRARFSAPVYPGETLSTRIWNDAEGVSFKTVAIERSKVVLDSGRALLAA
jgi:acyl dehydratase